MINAEPYLAARVALGIDHHICKNSCDPDFQGEVHQDRVDQALIFQDFGACEATIMANQPANHPTNRPANQTNHQLWHRMQELESTPSQQ